MLLIGAFTVVVAGVVVAGVVTVAVVAGVVAATAAAVVVQQELEEDVTREATRPLAFIAQAASLDIGAPGALGSGNAAGNAASPMRDLMSAALHITTDVMLYGNHAVQVRYTALTCVVARHHCMVAQHT